MIKESDEVRLFLTLFETSVNNTFEPSNYKTEETLNSFIAENKGLLFVPKEINEQLIEKVKKAILKLSDIGFKLNDKLIAFRMDTDRYLTTKELQVLIKLEEFLKENKAYLTIEAEDLFSLDEIISTNDKLNSEIDYINSLTVPTENNRPLNEMEKFILAYDFCTNFKYNENKKNKSASRYITSILNGDNIVCVGYSRLLSEMCRRLNIECHGMGITCIDKKTQKEDGHRNNIAVINNKMYYADACWDCARSGDKGLKLYNHCLIPIEDRNHVVDCNVEYDKFNNLPKTPQHLEKALKMYKALKNDEISHKECRDFIMSYYDITSKPINDDEIDDKNEKSWEVRYQKLEKNRTLKKLEFLIKYLKDHQHGEAISYEIFEQSLMNIYLAKGMDQKKAQNLLERTMEINEKRALKCFDENATNCFIKGKTNELKV